jgi:diketogulonate reductase-like aldo/keto reductase
LTPVKRDGEKVYTLAAMPFRPPQPLRWPRRRLLQALGAAFAGTALPLHAQAGTARLRSIPASGERLPVIGVGSWITFNVSPESGEEAPLVPVMRNFLAAGGGMIDSSPMYGYSEAVIGDLLRELGAKSGFFSATKIWTPSVAMGRWQLEQSRKLWGVPRFDVVHVHNMVNWRGHLATLEAAKADGRVRYIGITTSHGALHDEMARALSSERFDFVQFTYNFADRSVERKLLPLAADRGTAVVINRPFDGGHLFASVRGRALPDWAREIDCANWAQFFLKFVVSHPAVSCAIPATSNPGHMKENMGAGTGRMPDAAMRERMVAHMESL